MRSIVLHMFADSYTLLGNTVNICAGNFFEVPPVRSCLQKKLTFCVKGLASRDTICNTVYVNVKTVVLHTLWRSRSTRSHCAHAKYACSNLWLKGARESQSTPTWYTQATTHTYTPVTVYGVWFWGARVSREAGPPVRDVHRQAHPWLRCNKIQNVKGSCCTDAYCTKTILLMGVMTLCYFAILWYSTFGALQVEPHATLWWFEVQGWF